MASAGRQITAGQRAAVCSCICQNGAMQRFDRITWDPSQMNGQPCIRGLRLTVRRVVESVALYPRLDDLYRNYLHRNYPELEPEDVRQALAFAASNLQVEETGAADLAWRLLRSGTGRTQWPA